MQVAIRVVAVVAVGLFGAVACVPPTNPYDPGTPAEQQAKASLEGAVVIDAALDAAVITSDLATLQVTLLGEDGRAIEENGVPVTRALVDLDTANQRGRFVFDGLTPATYTVRLETASYYLRPATPAVQLLPGDTVTLADIVLTSSTELGTGPGSIDGELVFAEGSGVSRLTAYRLRNGAVEQVASAVNGGGSFSFTGLDPGRYAIAAESDGYAPVYRLSIDLHDDGAEGLHAAFTGEEALTHHAVSGVLLPQPSPLVLTDEGIVYVRGDALPLTVLAFDGSTIGVTGMRFSFDAGFSDAPDFVAYALTTTVPLPDVQGALQLYAQFEARDADGFAFRSETFALDVVRDTEAPVLQALSFPGLAEGVGNVLLARADAALGIGVVAEAQDVTSGVDGLALMSSTTDVAPAPVFTDVTAPPGLVRLNNLNLTLDASGTYFVFATVVDRAGNVSDPVRVQVEADFTLPDALPIVVDNLEGVALPVRTAQLHFDTSGATTDLPTEMQVGTAPLDPAAPRVPFSSTFAFTLGDTFAEPADVTFAARLYDAVGNAIDAGAVEVPLRFRSRVTGSVSLEGVPGILPDAQGVVARVLERGVVRQTAVSDASGAFLIDDVPESSDATLELVLPGFRTERVGLGALPALALADSPVDAGASVLSLARGSARGVFRLKDIAAASTGHAGIVVSAHLDSATRVFDASPTVTSDDGSFLFEGLPATAAGEQLLLTASRAEYVTATATVTIADRATSVVAPDGSGAPTVLLLTKNAGGDFDVCSASGPCTATGYISGADARVRLRDVSDVAALRVSARTPFLAGDALPAFVPFDGSNQTPVVVGAADASDDGFVDLYVQVQHGDGSTGAVLTATIVKDTLPPTNVTVAQGGGTGALDPRFARTALIPVVGTASAGTGNVAPLDELAIEVLHEDDAPGVAATLPPPTAQRCTVGAACNVVLPGAATDSIVEGLHRVFAWSCDLAGNCAAPQETFVIYDHTPPGEQNGVAFGVEGPGAVVSPTETLLPSALYTATVNTGVAATELGASVRDENGDLVADVFGYRISRLQTAADATLRALSPAPLAGEDRTDLVTPALPPVDGATTLYAQLVDAAGNTTPVAPNPFARRVVVDTTAPSVSLRADNTLVRDTLVHLFVDVPPGGEVPAGIDVSIDDPVFASSVHADLPLPPAGLALVLPATDGAHTLRARISDAVGNSASEALTVTLDQTAPQIFVATCSTCTTSNGVQFAAGTAATLQVLASDQTSGVTRLTAVVSDVDAPGTTATFLEEPFDGNIAVDLFPGLHNRIALSVTDGAGNSTAVGSETVVVVISDADAPVISGLAVGEGAFARARLVEVRTTTASSDVTQMRVDVHSPPTGIASFSGSPVPFAASTFVTLPGADGAKEVCVQVLDAVGQSDEACTTITLDQSAPSGTIVLSGGVAATKNAAAVPVALTASADAVAYALAAGAVDCGTATLTAATFPVATTVAVPTGDGTKVVTACFADAAGNVSTASDDIVLDTRAPEGTLVLNGGAAFTNSAALTLALTTGDATTMSVAEGSRTAAACAGATFVAAASSATLTVTSTNGTKTVSVCLRDVAGNDAVLNQAISLDTVAPTVSVAIEGGAAYTRTTGVAVTLAANETVDVALAATDPSCAAVSYESFAASKAFTLPGPDGTAAVFACFKDAAGNTTKVQDTIVLDRAAPGGTLSINGGAATTSVRAVVAGVGFDGDTAELAVSATSSSCGELTYSAPSAAVSVTLLAGRGDKSVFACLRDAAGNTTLLQDTIFLDESESAGLSIAINGGALAATNRTVLVSLSAPTDATLMKVVEGATIDCVSPVGYEAYTSTKSVLLAVGAGPLFEGTRVISACVQTSSALTLGPSQDSIYLDTFVPNGTVRINGNAAATNSLNVTLSLTADSDVHEVAVSTDGAFSCATATYETFAATKPFALAGPDGSNSVFACLRDDGGNTRLLSDSISLDRTAPTPVGISVPAFVTSAAVTAALSFPADAVEVAVAEGSLSCSSAVYGAIAATANLTLSSGDGSKVIVACFRDAGGNASQAVTATVLDTIDPNGSVSIDSGAVYSTDLVLGLQITPPSDATQMAISDGAAPTCASATYVALVTQPSYTLAAGDGTRTVNVCLKDAAGRTALLQDTVIVDTTRPAGSVSINGGDAYTSTRTVGLSVTRNPGSEDAAELAFADGATLACASAVYQPFSASLPHILPSGDGTKSVAVCLKDRAGNTAAASFADSIELDQTPPSSSNASVSIAAGATYTTSATVALALTFPSDVTEMALANDGLDCTSATYVAAASSVASYTLSTADGTKTVVACLRDRARNTYLATDTIELDTQAPTSSNTAVTINGGDERTASSTLALTVQAPSDVADVAYVEGTLTQAACNALATGFAALASPTAFPLASTTEGTKTISACFRENAGRRLVVSDAIYLDPNRPTLTAFTLNGGATATISRDVTAAIAGASTDTVSMVLANGAIADCAAASPYVPFTPSLLHQLTSTDGSKTVSLCLKDTTGNVSASASTATISLDTAAPASVGVTLAAGAAATTTASGVAVALSYATTAGNAVRYALAEGSIDCATATRTALSGTSPDATTINLSSGDGTKTVVACFYDAAGNIATAQDSITLDQTAPSGTVSLASGAVYSVAVAPVAFVVPDDTSEVALQVDGTAPTCASVSAVSFVALPSTVNLGSDGSHTVYACFRDAAGNRSASPVSDSVIVDTTAPTVTSFLVNGSSGTVLTNALVVTVSVAATDANGPLQMALGNNALACSTASYTGLTALTQHTIPASASTTLHLCVKDAAGNTTTTSANTRNISLDQTPPALPSTAVVISDGGDGYITSAGATTVALSWSTAGDVAFVKAAEGSIDCAASSGYTAAGAGSSTSASVSLSSGDGTKTVVACFQDAAGNTTQASDQTVLDTAAPSGTITVAAGDAKTRLSALVPVTVSSSASDVTTMAIIDTTSGSTQTCATGTYATFAASGTLAAFASATNGTKTVGVCFRDAAGNQSTTAAATDTIVLDTALTSTGVSISLEGVVKDGALSGALTRVQAVTVTVTGAAADVADIEIANDSGFAGASQDVFGNGVVYPFLLDPGDGTKDIFVRLTDDAGNTVTFSDGSPAGTDLSIVLDTNAPSAPAALLKSGDDYATSHLAMPVALSAQTSGSQDGTLDVRVSVNDADFADGGEGWTATVPTAVSFASGDGKKTLYAQFRDAAGNETAVVTDSITLDSAAPVPVADIACPSTSQVVCVNAGASYSSSVSAVVQLSSSVAGDATEVQVATDGTADTEPFIPYSTYITVLLPSGDATKTVAVKFRDAAGNTTASASTDSIILDTTRPTAPVIANRDSITNGSNAAARVIQVMLLTGSTDANGVTYQVVGGPNYPDFTNAGAAPPFNIPLTAGNGASTCSSDEKGSPFSLGVRAVDPAGNTSAEDYLTVVCDDNPPSAPSVQHVDERSGSITVFLNPPGGGLDPDVVGVLLHYGDHTDQTGRVVDGFSSSNGPSPLFLPVTENGLVPLPETLSGLVDDVQIYLQVVAVDAAGNQSPTSASASALPNPVAPVSLIAEATSPSATGDIAMEKGRAFYINGTRLCRVDLTDPTVPGAPDCSALGSVNTDDKITIFGNQVFLWRPINGSGSQLRAVDVSSGSPGTVTNVEGSIDTLLAHGRDLIAGVDNGLRVLRVPNSSTGLGQDWDNFAVGESATLAMSSISGTTCGGAATCVPLKLASGGGQIVLLYDEALSRRVVPVGLSLTPAGDKTGLNSFGTSKLITGTSDIAAAPGLLVVAGSYGLKLYDIDPSAGIGANPIGQVGGFDCGRVVLTPGLAFCTDNTGGAAQRLVVVDLNDTTQPRIVGRSFIGTGADQYASFAVSENVLVATTSSGHLSVQELWRPQRIEPVGAAGIDYRDAAVVDMEAYAISNVGTVDFVNLTSPRTLTFLSPTAGLTNGVTNRKHMAAWGNWVVAVSGNAGTAFEAFLPRSDFMSGAPVVQKKTAARSSTVPCPGSDNTDITVDIAVSGNSLLALTNDGRVEHWALAQRDGTGNWTPTCRGEVALGLGVGGGSPVALSDLIENTAMVLSTKGRLTAIGTTAGLSILGASSDGVVGTDITGFDGVEMRLIGGGGGRTIVGVVGRDGTSDVDLARFSVNGVSGSGNTVTIGLSQAGSYGAPSLAGRYVFVPDGKNSGTVNGVYVIDATTWSPTALVTAVRAPWSSFTSGSYVFLFGNNGVETLFVNR